MRIRFIVFGIIFLFCLAVAEASTASFYLDTRGNGSEETFSEILRSGGVVFKVTTSESAVCKYSEYEGTSFANMDRTFDFSFETLHKKDMVGLTDGVYTHYVRCKNEDDSVSGELEATFAVSLPVSAQIILEDGEIVGEGRTEVLVQTSKAVSQTPSLSYSFDGISYDPIPLYGSGTEWKGYLMISDSNEEITGSFKFQARDLEGVLGEEVTSGGTFFVDTKKPDTISDVNAVGHEGEIRLSWELEEDEDIEEYRVYRSSDQGVDYSDFYKDSEDDMFIDTNVDRGRTYYYRVAGVDEAGNLADLSKEVYATALLQNVTVSTGLELRYVGFVDNFISEIESVADLADDSLDDFREMGKREGDLYESLKLEREVNGAKSELSSLKREVENYKSQSLTRSELDKRLNSAKLKLNTIRRKIPESLIIVSEKVEDRAIEEEAVTSTILRLWPDILGSLGDKRVEASISLMEDRGFDVRTEAYNLEVVYLDGTRRDVALIREDVDFEHDANDSVYLIEVVPEGIASSASDLSVKNVNYDVLKEDTVLSFSADTGEILYTLDEHIDMDKLRDIDTFVLYEVHEDLEPETSITGYFSYVGLDSGGSYFGVGIAVLLIAALGGYLFYIRRDATVSDKLVPLRQIISDAERSLHTGKYDVAKDLYHAASLHYRGLDKNLQKAVYGDLEILHRKIAGGVR